MRDFPRSSCLAATAASDRLVVSSMPGGLRQAIRRHVPGLALGGWANPHAECGSPSWFSAGRRLQWPVLLDAGGFALRRRASGSVSERSRTPGIDDARDFRVFYYRSASPKTFAALRRFLPVPADELIREFETGASPEEVCARTITWLRRAGARHVYVSNLPVGRSRQTLERILELVGAAAGARTIS